MTPRLLPLLLLLLAGPPSAQPAPPTCYSRMLTLSREVAGDFQSLQAAEPSEPCVRYLPTLYLDIHNYCVLARLRDFVASPQCWKVAQVDALKDKVRKLYTIMNSFCRRDVHLRLAVHVPDSLSDSKHGTLRVPTTDTSSLNRAAVPAGMLPTVPPRKAEVHGERGVRFYEDLFIS
ncbi:cytokine-like protein 1 [Ailuropoda melanoleuca]|uniref:cytokine-like protein 1 n=1 Tax=Ailuropoda melanoleuca TaxID=9646 RepID=UPI00149422EE|nr:cytokine-like protein 1 [Ailuropoda melanoleuca]